MALKRPEENKEAPKGFGGLDSLVSDIEIPPASAEDKKTSHASARTEKPTADSESPKSSSQISSIVQEDPRPKSGTAGTRLLLGILGLVVVAIVIGPNSKNQSFPQPTASPPSQTSAGANALSKSSSTESVSQQASPKFAEYPSELYAGPRAAVQLVTPFDRTFRTRIRNTQSQDVNFSGEYIVSTWGCGTSCATGVAVSARTGKVIELPGTVCCWKGEGNNIIFRKDSRLLVLAGLINEQGRHGAHFYELRNNKFVHIKTVEVDDQTANSGGEETPRTLDASRPNVAPAPLTNTKVSSPEESMPPTGQNVLLSAPQIRYCLAEEIRIDGSKSSVDNYSDSGVDLFNAYVADFNSRCGSFRYRTGALESARRDVEPYRSQLQAEGRSRFARSPSLGSLSAPAPTRPAADETVRAVQRKLNELGYNAGPADGLMGRGTRAAITAFQQDRGLAATGAADQALLLQLQQAPTRSNTTTAEPWKSISPQSPTAPAI